MGYSSFDIVRKLKLVCFPVWFHIMTTSPHPPQIIFYGTVVVLMHCIAHLQCRHGVLHRWVHAVVLWTAPSSSTQMVPRVFEEHRAWPAMEKRSCPLISAATPVQSPAQHFQPADWLIQSNAIRETSSDRKDTQHLMRSVVCQMLVIAGVLYQFWQESKIQRCEHKQLGWHFTVRFHFWTIWWPNNKQYIFLFHVSSCPLQNINKYDFWF